MGELLEQQLSFGLDMPRDEQVRWEGVCLCGCNTHQQGRVEPTGFFSFSLECFFSVLGVMGSSGGTDIARDKCK